MLLQKTDVAGKTPRTAPPRQDNFDTPSAILDAVFQLTRPGQKAIEHRIAAARMLPCTSPALLTLEGGPIRPLPPGYAHDHSRSELGPGRAAFVDARHALERWVEFDLGWVSVANPSVPIAVGEIVAVLARTSGLWSLNLSRITETVDTPTRFGFLYSTTTDHVEQGQERFLVEFDEEHGTVIYLVEALSRPRHPLARLVYPFARAMQYRFRKHTHQRMHSAVTAPDARLP